MRTTDPLAGAISTIEQALQEPLLAVSDARIEESKRQFRSLLRATLRYMESQRDGRPDTDALADHAVTNAVRLGELLEGLPDVSGRPAMAYR